MFSVDISSTNPRHAYLNIFQGGGLAGTLCVEVEAAPVLMAALSPPNADLCPHDIRQCIQDYVTKGWEPGSFVQYVLANNLTGAWCCADDNNRYYLPHIVAWMYQHIPAQAWGSAERVGQWLASIAKQKDDIQ